MKIPFCALLLALSLGGAQAAGIIPASEGAVRVDFGRSVYGTFAMTVQSTGDDYDIFFLNSEKDCRNPRNLSPSLRSHAVDELKTLYGKDLTAFFTGRPIWVTGTAMRVPVAIVRNGQRVGGYFQHRVEVTRASQISLTPPQ